MARINFGKLSEKAPASPQRLIDPRAIFSALPSKAPGLDYLRGPQDQVLAEWHRRRDTRDLVIKMNTGGGKTLVGLLIARSWLNEGIKSVAYLVPDHYLAEQVRAEAQRLGIEATDDPRSPAFSSGRAVLVTVFAKLFNGQSIFGVAGSAGRSPVVELGAVLIDDAHACLAQAEDTFRVKIASSDPVFDQILNIFDDVLEQQSASGLMDLRNKRSAAIQQVPYWAWADRQQEVLKVLNPLATRQDLKFAWPLLVDALPISRAVLSGDGLEIAPPCHPSSVLTGFAKSQRRIYLTATLADDGVLVRDFAAAPTAVTDPIVPANAGDIGDRLILVPQLTYPQATDDEVRALILALAKQQNVVVIVPSRTRAEYWKDDAALVLAKEEIAAGIAQLRTNPRLGLVVLINRYDGVDLPGDACHVLVLDGLPEALDGIERLEQAQLSGSRRLLARQIQRLEQGMGRGTRSNEDHCVVMLLGARLAQRLHASEATQGFSPATRTQLELAAEIASELEGGNVTDLSEVIDQCLSRDQDWLTYSRARLAEVQYEKPQLGEGPTAERKAFEHAAHGEYSEAITVLQPLVNTAHDTDLQGYHKQQLAAYTHPVDPATAQQIQRSANRLNRNLLRPIAGVAYEQLTPSTAEQATTASGWLQQQYVAPTDLALGFNVLLQDLVWGSRTKPFEQAWCDLAWHLGMAGQRPEQDTGRGPDGLWALPDASFIVTEAKSGATNTHPVYKKDAEQLSNSMDWFRSQYPQATSTPLLIHPRAQFDRQAAAPTGCRVITTEKLTTLREALQAFAEGLAHEDAYRDPTRVSRLLAAHSLSAQEFLSRHSVAARANI